MRVRAVTEPAAAHGDTDHLRVAETIIGHHALPG
jgi:hypothetical protein